MHSRLVSPALVALATSLCICSPITLAGPVTNNLSFDSGSSNFSGTVGGSASITVKSGGATVNVTDLDIVVQSAGGFLNLFPNGSSYNNTASASIAVNPTTVTIDVPTTAASSTVSGSIAVTADDNATDTQLGVLGGLAPGSDGKWDDPNRTGILNNASANGFNVSLNNPISGTANVSGAIGGSLTNNVTIPNVVDTTFLDADLTLKNSSNFNIVFDPVQTLSIQNLSISTSDPTALPNPSPVAGFVEGTHPLDGMGYLDVQDLSVNGGGLVATTVSGNLVVDISGTVYGSVDLRADLEVIGIINIPVDFDNVVDGELGSGNLLSLNESITLSDLELPFGVTIFHSPTTNVDYDDVIAALATGTLGLTLPFNINETDVMIDIPTTSFGLQNLTYNVDEGFYARGSVTLENLAAELSGQIVTDINADINLSADLVAQALAANVINVPEASTMTLLGLAGVVFGAGAVVRRLRSA